MITENAFAGLSDKEKIVLDLLLNVSGESPYAYACRKIKAESDFRKLVAHFQQQAVTSSLLVEIIIGKSALEAVLSLEGSALNSSSMAVKA